MFLWKPQGEYTWLLGLVGLHDRGFWMVHVSRSAKLLTLRRKGQQEGQAQRQTGSGDGIWGSHTWSQHFTSSAAKEHRFVEEPLGDSGMCSQQKQWFQGSQSATSEAPRVCSQPAAAKASAVEVNHSQRLRKLKDIGSQTIFLKTKNLNQLFFPHPFLGISLRWKRYIVGWPLPELVPVKGGYWEFDCTAAGAQMEFFLVFFSRRSLLWFLRQSVNQRTSIIAPGCGHGRHR